MSPDEVEKDLQDIAVMVAQAFRRQQYARASFLVSLMLLAKQDPALAERCLMRQDSLLKAV